MANVFQNMWVYKHVHVHICTKCVKVSSGPIKLHVCTKICLRKYVWVHKTIQMYMYISANVHAYIWAISLCLSSWVYIYPCNHYLERWPWASYRASRESWLRHLTSSIQHQTLSQRGSVRIKWNNGCKGIVPWLAQSKCSININFPYLDTYTDLPLCIFTQL